MALVRIPTGEWLDPSYVARLRIEARVSWARSDFDEDQAHSKDGEVTTFHIIATLKNNEVIEVIHPVYSQEEAEKAMSQIMADFQEE